MRNEKTSCRNPRWHEKKSQGRKSLQPFLNFIWITRGEEEANISDEDFCKSPSERRNRLELMVNIQFQRLHVVVIQLRATELNRERKEGEKKWEIEKIAKIVM